MSLLIWPPPQTHCLLQLATVDLLDPCAQPLYCSVFCVTVDLRYDLSFWEHWMTVWSLHFSWESMLPWLVWFLWNWPWTRCDGVACTKIRIIWWRVSMLIWAAEVFAQELQRLNFSTSSDDGGEPHDSSDEVSTAGWEGGEVNQVAAVIGPNSTAKDTGAAIVEIDAAVGIPDVDNTGIETVEPMAKNKVATWKTLSHLNKIAPKTNFKLQPDTLKHVKTWTLLLHEAAKHLKGSIAIYSMV